MSYNTHTMAAMGEELSNYVSCPVLSARPGINSNSPALAPGLPHRAQRNKERKRRKMSRPQRSRQPTPLALQLADCPPGSEVHLPRQNDDGSRYWSYCRVKEHTSDGCLRVEVAGEGVVTVRPKFLEERREQRGSVLVRRPETGQPARAGASTNRNKDLGISRVRNDQTKRETTQSPRKSAKASAPRILAPIELMDPDALAILVEMLEKDIKPDYVRSSARKYDDYIICFPARLLAVTSKTLVAKLKAARPAITVEARNPAEAAHIESHGLWRVGTFIAVWPIPLQMRSGVLVGNAQQVLQDKDLPAMAHLPCLHTLDLSQCALLHAADGLQGCKRLQSLDLSKCKALTDVSALGGCSSLHTLNLSNCDSLTAIGALASCSSLHTLDLSSCRSLMDIGALAGCSSLHTLHLSGCSNLTNIDVLSHLPGLHVLKVSGMGEEALRSTEYRRFKGLIGMSSRQNLALALAPSARPIARPHPHPRPQVSTSDRCCSLEEGASKLDA